MKDLKFKRKESEMEERVQKMMGEYGWKYLPMQGVRIHIYTDI